MSESSERNASGLRGWFSRLIGRSETSALRSQLEDAQDRLMTYRHIARMPFEGDDSGGGGGDHGGGGTQTNFTRGVFNGPNGPVEGDAMANEAMELVSTVYACVTKIAEAIAMTPLRFYQGRGEDAKEIEREPGNIVDLLAHANSRDTGFELIQQVQSSLDLNGNAFIFEQVTGGRITGFTTLPPHLVSIKMGDNGLPRAYVLNINGKNMDLPPELVIHVKYFNPRWAERGMSPLVAGAGAWQTHFYASEHGRTVLMRGGEGTSYFESDSALDGPALDRLERKLAQRHTNPAFKGRPVVLPKGIKRIQAMMSADELKVLETKVDSKQDIMEVYGVPPWKLGVKIGGTLIGGGGGAEVDERMWVTDTLMPRGKRIAEVLNEQLLPLFGEDVWCEFDFSRHPAMQASFLATAKAVSEVVNKVFTPNEGRELLGYEPLKGDEFDTITAPASPFGGGGSGSPDAGSSNDPNADQNQDPSAPDNAKALAVQERNQRRRQHSRSLLRYERKAHKLVTAQMHRQERAVLAQLGISDRAPSNPLELADILNELEPQERDEWAEFLRDLIENRGEEVLSLLGAEVDLRLNEQRWAAFLRQHVNRAIKASDTTRIMLRERISKELENGSRIEQITAAVREVFNGRRDNALTIARTETQPAYNAATLEAADQSGVVRGKMWVAVHDDVVRESHLKAEANGIIPLSDAFDVDGEQLQYPGDITASVGNVANCRCGLQFALVTDRGIRTMNVEDAVKEVERQAARERIGRWLLQK